MDRCAPGDDQHERRTYSSSDCVQPVAEGECSDAVEVRWYYDAARRDCTAFYYTGCDGSNGNNFRHYDDCYAFCGAAGTRSPTPS